MLFYSMLTILGNRETEGTLLFEKVTDFFIYFLI